MRDRDQSQERLLSLKALVQKSAVNPTPGWIGRAALAELLKRVAEGA